MNRFLVALAISVAVAVVGNVGYYLAATRVAELEQELESRSVFVFWSSDEVRESNYVRIPATNRQGVWYWSFNVNVFCPGSTTTYAVKVISSKPITADQAREMAVGSGREKFYHGLAWEIHFCGIIPQEGVLRDQETYRFRYI